MACAISIAQRVLKALPFQFRSFRARILVFVIGLLVVLQAAGFLIVNSANTRNALRQISEALEVTASVFNRSISERNQRLLEKARLLSADYAFKQAFATHEHATVLSVLDNHQRRIGANVMMLISLDQRIIADTLHPELNGEAFALPGLIEQAMNSDHGEASAIEIIDGNPYQVVIVPLYSPGPSAWIVIGFSIGDSFAKSLQITTKSEVSLLRREKQKAWALIASTLSMAERDGLSKTQIRWPDGNPQSVQLDMGGREYVSLVTPLSRGDEKTILAVLQRDLGEALRPHMRIRVVLIALFFGGLVFSIIGGFMIARTVTRPVLALAEGARSIEEGDYTHTVSVKQQDEIGMLANTFNQMAKGLEERDRVRNLLGKVVSPAIAEKLLSEDIELGGEEREVTVLFSDVRKFTDLCENRSPTDILSLLNRYLTQITSVVESNGGVVDKYVGDAIMALYGAPLSSHDDAARAVTTALEMQPALEALNQEFQTEGLPRLAIGVGINTAVVVAGNMGSMSRLNYTVIGDGVNLASRLEMLTKRYNVPVIVSGATKQAAGDVVYRELDRVRVKGKVEPVDIFQPLAPAGVLDETALQELADYHKGLEEFRHQNWDAARIRFASLLERSPACLLYQLYSDRIEQFKKNPPPSTWNGVTIYDEK